MVVSDNGKGPTSNAILKWQEEHMVNRYYIAQGEPMQNGFVESFTVKVRDECLNYAHWPYVRRPPRVS